MFHLLRKIVLLIFYGLLIGLGVFLYQKRAVLNPVLDYYDAWEISREDPRKDRETLAGEVIQVTGAYSFQLQNQQGFLFNFQLTGFDPISPSNRLDAAASELKDESQMRLARLILSNEVRVAATFLSPQRTGLGVVYRDETNVNAALLEDGLARLNRHYLKGLTRSELYEMLQAERKAKEQKLGIWKE